MSVTLPSPPKSASLPQLVEDLLREQQELTAVERFSRHHAEHDVPAQSRYYQALLPQTLPGIGEQYGFDVDLDRCSGCKACVTACHALNGLDDHETWRDVGLLVGGSYQLPVLQHVTTACHHCVDPGCLLGCPTLAYEKDPQTGIVKHLDDQCFGCQYCILACPYDVPKYHSGKGIVRKCDMCSSRLKRGEAPACVQACPHEAIRIRIVSVEDARARSVSGEFLPNAPDPAHTCPTTVYRSARLELNDLRSGDDGSAVPEHAHVPLIVLLVLSQISVGIAGATILAAATSSSAALGLALLAWGLGATASGAATLHLGRPWLAYRAFLGVRTSWLSREILAFGGYQGLCSALVGALIPQVATFLGLDPRGALAIVVATALAAATTLQGLAGIWCSVKIYAVTPRPYWRIQRTALWFFGTSTLAAFWTALLVPLLPSGLTTAALLTTSLVLVGVESRLHIDGARDRWMERSIRLLRGPLKTLWRWRVGLLAAGSIVGPIGVLFARWAGSEHVAIAVSAAAVTTTVASVVCERVLFFQAAAATRMPGRLAG